MTNPIGGTSTNVIHAFLSNGIWRGRLYTAIVAATVVVAVSIISVVFVTFVVLVVIAADEVTNERSLGGWFALSDGPVVDVLEENPTQISVL